MSNNNYLKLIILRKTVPVKSDPLITYMKCYHLHYLVWMWKLLVVPVCSKSWIAAAKTIARISNSLSQCCTHTHTSLVSFYRQLSLQAMCRQAQLHNKIVTKWYPHRCFWKSTSVFVWANLRFGHQQRFGKWGHGPRKDCLRIQLLRIWFILTAV